MIRQLSGSELIDAVVEEFRKQGINISRDKSTVTRKVRELYYNAIPLVKERMPYAANGFRDPEEFIAAANVVEHYVEESLNILWECLKEEFFKGFDEIQVIMTRW